MTQSRRYAATFRQGETAMRDEQRGVQDQMAAADAMTTIMTTTMIVEGTGGGMAGKVSTLSSTPRSKLTKLQDIVEGTTLPPAQKARRPAVVSL